MKTKPIIFNGTMIRALLDDRKTQTRRVVQRARHPYGEMLTPDQIATEVLWNTGAIRCPYGQPGELLWVRETWQGYRRTSYEYDEWDEIQDAADRAEHGDAWSWVYKADGENFPNKWFPSIHMPRSASRLTLEITDVRVERVQDISERDAKAEGIGDGGFGSQASVELDGGRTHHNTPQGCFRKLWDSIYAKRGHGWDANPYVWALTFKVHSCNVDQLAREAV